MLLKGFKTFLVCGRKFKKILEKVFYSSDKLKLKVIKLKVPF